MSILSDFFIADKAIIPNYDGSADFPAEDRCQFNSITPLEAAGILSVIRGGGDRIAIIKEFSLLTPEDAEEWTMSIPDDMVAGLARLNDSEIPVVAQQCADVTTEELGWSQDEFRMVISQLRDLSRRANETNKSVYLWNSL